MRKETQLKLLLHIGQHKTGSKSLQYFLSRNQAELLRHHCSYDVRYSLQTSHAYRHSHFHWFDVLRRIGQDRNSAEREFSDLFARQLTIAKGAGAHTCIVSAEDLFVMQTAHQLEFDELLLRQAIQCIKGLCDSYNVNFEAVVYIRDRSEFLDSSYAQFIKGESRGSLSRSEFAQRFGKRLDSAKVVSIWNEYLVGGECVARDYQSADDWDVRRDFLVSVLNISPADFDFSLPEDLHAQYEIQNRSPAPFVTSLYRLGNKYNVLNKMVLRHLLRR